MPDAYPLPSADPASLGFAATPLQHLDRLIRQHIEEKPLPRRADRAGASREAGAVPHLWRCQDRGPEPAGDGRHAFPAVQPDQGADQLRGLDIDRGRQALVHGPDCRSPAGVRQARQGRDHLASGHDPSGRLSERRRDPGDLDRSHEDARRGLRFLARLDAGNAAAIPPARRASDPGDGHRGGYRAGLSRRDPGKGAGAARAREGHLCRRPAERAGALRRHLCARGP